MIDFEHVDAVDAEAIGPPGERTFRLRARVGDSYAALWMEKEQLAAVGRSFSTIRSFRSMAAPLPSLIDQGSDSVIGSQRAASI